MKRFLLAFGVICAALQFTIPATAQEVQPRAWEHETSDIAPNDRIHFGHFANGVRFAWVQNTEPQERLYLRLHVDAGSLGEKPSEAGMAHYLEHMAFNGSEHFEAGTLVEWFQERGMSFGADLNAHTAFSETVYKLDLPNNDEQALREGLQVLQDFAFLLDLTDKEVQAEKGVIDGEQRERDSAQWRVLLKLLDTIFGGTLVPTHLPIGTEDIRAAFTGQTIRDFYTKWYRPENMTLVLVGDLQGLNPEPLFHEFFGQVSVPEGPLTAEPEIGRADVLDQKEVIFSIYELEIPTVSISMGKLKPYVEKPQTVAILKEEMPFHVANAMLNLRYAELVKKEECKFLGAAAASMSQGLGVFDGGSIDVNAEPANWEAALVQAEVELRRALKFGFQEAELAEVRAGMMRGLEESAERASTRHSKALLGDVVMACEKRIVPSSPATDLEVVGAILQAMTVDDCLDAMRAHWKGGTLMLSTTGDLDLGETAESELKRVHESVKKMKIEAGAAVSVADFAYASDETIRGVVVQKGQVADMSIQTYVFENGVRLNLKKTDFKERQILLNARVGEGSLSYDSSGAVVAHVASQAIPAAGLGKHTADELRRMTAGKTVGTSLGFGADAFELGGSTTQEDLLLQLELMVATMNDPGTRTDGLRMFAKQYPLQLEQMKHMPQGPLLLDFFPQLVGGDVRHIPMPSLEEALAVDMDAIHAWLKPALEAAPIELAIVGDIDIDATVAAVAQTFGTLPKRRERHDTTERRQFAGMVSGLSVESTIETQTPQALVFIAYPACDGTQAANRRNLTMLGEILGDRIRLIVREELGAAYSPSAGAEANQVFFNMGVLQIYSMAQPDNVPSLREACLKVASDLAKDGVTEEEVNRLAEPLLKGIRDSKRKNGYWLSVCSEAQTDAEGLEDFRSVEGFFQNLSAAALSEMAAEYLVRDNASVLSVTPMVK
ncbi:MAG: insulinase family protein [Planctomycetes bacterium]|jgi:zinc protease|nr:insulinase family protein [Planctomycetota bacterium]